MTSNKLDLHNIRNVCIDSIASPHNDDTYMAFIKLGSPELIVSLIDHIEELESLVKSLENEHHHVVCSLEEELNEKIELLKQRGGK